MTQSAEEYAPPQKHPETAPPRLSLCFPTYNRAGCLREMLQSVQVALAKIANPELVEIVISDNASPDDTASVAAEWSRHLPNLRYHRNETNIGSAPNFHRVLTLATGDYLWMLGDDDALEPDALSTALREIESSPSAILLNYSTWDRQLQTRLKANARGLDKDQTSLTPQELLAQHGPHLGFISTVIMERSVFEAVPYSDCQPYADYGFTQIYMIFAGLIRAGHTCRFLARPVLRNRTDNPGQFDWYKYFVEGMAMVYAQLNNDGYPKSSTRRARSLLIREFILGRISYDTQRKSLPRRRLLRLGLQWYADVPVWWCLVLPILCTPTSLLILSRSVFLRIRAYRNRIDSRSHASAA